MAKKRSVFLSLVLVVGLVLLSAPVYAQGIGDRYGPGYDKWFGNLIPAVPEFGPDDEVGRLNWMQNTSLVLQAAKLIKRGKTIDLSFTVDRYSPNWPGHPPFEVVTFRSPFGEWNQRDQGWMEENNEAQICFASEVTIHCQHTGTHMDGLAHVVFGPDYCGYNGISLKTQLGDFGLLKAGAETVPPVFCRGVLLDVAAYKGVSILKAGYEITVDDIKGTLRKQGTRLKKGDAVCIRTGVGQNWPDKKKATLCPGPGYRACLWLLEQGMMIGGTDTVAFEVQPTPGGVGPVVKNPHPAHEAMFHHGVHIIEFLNLEELAKKQVYEFVFVTATNNFRGATGSNIRPFAVY
jgi:kynurenine formamidase